MQIAPSHKHSIDIFEAQEINFTKRYFCDLNYNVISMHKWFECEGEVCWQKNPSRPLRLTRSFYKHG